MKYIVFIDNSAILFGDHLSHDFMANGRPVKSAGRCCIETGRNSFDDVIIKHCSCFGESTTLGVKADLDDSQIVAEVFRGMY